MGAVLFICRVQWLHTNGGDALSEKVLSLSILVLIGIVVYFSLARSLKCRGRIDAVAAMLGIKGGK